MKNRELLIRGMGELGTSPSVACLEAFGKFLDELKRWNRAYNLTALDNDQDIVIKHFLDSMLYLKLIPPIPSGGAEAGSRIELCDIGSGAGFPGLPIAIVRPDIAVTLIEPTRKKTAFLRHMRRTLSLTNVDIIEARIEDISGIFDIAVTRALFGVVEMVEKAGHVVKAGGMFILNKGPKVDEELKGLPRGMEYKISPADLPLTSLKRNLICVQKIS